MIALSCPHCGRKLRTNDEAAGKKVKCPNCGHTSLAPSADPQGSEAATLAPRPPSAVAPCPGGEAATLPPVPSPRAADEAETLTMSPSHMGSAAVPGYEILGELGRGGMGVVYKARQAKLGRVVALKMILSGAHAGEADLARFRTEAEAIARLQHPNIVQVFEVGEHGGLPFFSLEFCDGGSLEKKLNGTPLPPKEAAALVETLARAMDAAHQRGVIHRDLKPANVLLAEDGAPKITDFGLAKKLDEASQTASGAVMGTPSYMAPEQVGGKSGASADVYALGAILYECLTGRPPFKAATALDTMMQVAADEPVPPTQLQPRTPRDLETICLKCLRKEPAKRYASAAVLAEDLRRWRDGEPIAARPSGRGERLLKWVRRRPAAAALLAVSAGAVLGVIVVIDAARREANDRSREADERSRTESALRGAAEEAQRHLADEQAETRRQLDRTRRLLLAGQVARAAPLVEREPARALALLRDRDACPTDLRDFVWGYYHRLANRDLGTLTGHAGAISALALSADGRTLASAGPDGEGGTQVMLWDVATARSQGAFRCGGEDASALAFSPGGQLLAVAVNVPVAVTLWRVDDPARGRPLAAPPPIVKAVAFTADGNLVTAAGQGVKVWDVASGTAHASWDGAPGRRGYVFAPSDSVWAGFAADGRRVATAEPRPKSPARVFDVVAGKQIIEVANDGMLSAMALSPDGRWLELGRESEPASLWDLSDPHPRPRSLPLIGGSALFSPDSRVLAGPSVARDGDAVTSRLTLWDIVEGRERAHVAGFGGPGAVTPDGKGLFRIWDTRVELRDTQTGQLVAAYDHEDAGDRLVAPRYLAVTPDSRTLAVAMSRRATVERQGLKTDRPGVVHLWSLGPRAPSESVSVAGPFVKGLLTPDGSEVVAVNPAARLERWSVAERKRLRDAPLGASPNWVIFSPDGEHVVNQFRAQVAGKPIVQSPFIIRSTRTGQEEASISVEGAGFPVAFRADGRAVAFVTTAVDSAPPAGPKSERPAGRGNLTLFDLPGGAPLGSVPLNDAPTVPPLCVFSPGGREAALAFRTEIGLADFDTGEYRTVGRHASATPVMTWSLDGKRLAFADHAEVRVWVRPEPGRDSVTIRFPRGHRNAVTALAFSPDGVTLASAALMESVRLWDVVSGQERAELPVSTNTVYITSLAFTPDGRELRAFWLSKGTVVRWLSDAPNASP
jgi:predicted Zn finger-like uncharacterized protein